MKSEIPTLCGRLDKISRISQPSLTAIMDIIEFCWNAVVKYEINNNYPYYGQATESADKEAGQAEFRERINHIFRRNGVAFDLTEQGRIERLIPGPVGGALRTAVFDTGNAELNQLLETARHKILVPDDDQHRDALGKLSQVWERLKTIEHRDKRKGVTIMLNKAAGTSQPKFRDLLEKEAKALTDAGNNLLIRHSETNQERLETSQQVDYLFQRMFSLIHLILHATGRVR